MNYRHMIKTRHQSGTSQPGEKMFLDFLLWKNGQNNKISNEHGMSITAGGVGIGTTNPSALPFYLWFRFNR